MQKSLTFQWHNIGENSTSNDTTVSEEFIFTANYDHAPYYVVLTGQYGDVDTTLNFLESLGSRTLSQDRKETTFTNEVSVRGSIAIYRLVDEMRKSDLAR
ncbi:MAG: hypothetical protein HOC85_02695 [Acidiferrobacteraceae bacterium]|jgi:hypothetical protein|nr:hypothetical protein [Alphaproteobacteria bacterium]MBT4403955.1 hypothetical protein [Acidiferrobacteraceae bacterium]